MKKELQKVSKRVRGFRGKRFLSHLWSPKLIFDAKSEPTAPPKCPQGPKHASKMIPKGPKMILKVTLKVYSLGTLTLDRRFEQRPGGLREALTIRPPIGAQRSGHRACETIQQALVHLLPLSNSPRRPRAVRFSVPPGAQFLSKSRSFFRPLFRSPQKSPPASKRVAQGVPRESPKHQNPVKMASRRGVRKKG